MTGKDCLGTRSSLAPLLDRLTYKAHIVTCDWESYRLKESLADKTIGSRKRGKVTQKIARTSECRGTAPASPECNALETTGEAGKEKAG